MYNLTYLDTAFSMNSLLGDLVAYERGRLTQIIDRDERRQDYLRDDRAAVTAHTNEIVATNLALAKHYDAYQGDGAENPYANLTPGALRAAVASISTLRRIAQAEGEWANYWAHSDQVEVEIAVEQSDLCAELSAWDSFLWGCAVEINDTAFVPPFTEEEESGV